ncbi:MAG: hypothetical protein K0R38_88 [Polyangiaceae bacterium]|jgi:hypothetical protein|nr:hypothetical protein [Polyangiaceae bacterium]
MHCRQCACFYLENSVTIVEGNALCECSGIARVLPGGPYTAADESLFEAIVMCLEAAGITWMNANQLSAALVGREGRAPGDALHDLTDALPSLAVIELIATVNPLRARRAEGMFEGILDGLASTRSRSGVAPRFNAASSLRELR